MKELYDKERERLETFFFSFTLVDGKIMTKRAAVSHLISAFLIEILLQWKAESRLEGLLERILSGWLLTLPAISQSGLNYLARASAFLTRFRVRHAPNRTSDFPNEDGARNY